MIRAISLSVIIFLMLPACSQRDVSESDAQEARSTADILWEIERKRIQDQIKQQKWTYKRGIKSCDGYLTNNPSEEFCEDEVPPGWKRFEFQGHTYYVQELAASAH